MDRNFGYSKLDYFVVFNQSKEFYKISENEQENWVPKLNVLPIKIGS